MRFEVILRIALLSLWSHKLRSMVTVIGVTVGIAAIIFLVSLGYGLERLVTNQVADFEAFTVIDVPAANIKTIKIDQTAIDKIKTFGGVKAVAPVTNLAGRIYKTDGASTAETIITGGSPDYWKLSNATVEIGHLPTNDDEIVLNTAVLGMIDENANSVIGKKVKLDVIIPPENQTISTGPIKVEKEAEFRVVGVSSEEKTAHSLVPIARLEKIDATKYTTLKVKVDNRDNVPRIRKQIENNGFSTEYIGDTVQQISQFFSFFRIILFAFGFIALVVAALGTFNTLTISLLERIKEVGLFKALGMRNRDVYKIFLTEALLIGAAGGILGLTLGIVSGQIINMVLYFLADRAHVERIGIFETPMVFALIVAGFSLVLGFVTGWYPARRAVKIDPLDALRYE